MSTSFISAVEKHLPFIPIVFDRYHVMALMNKAIDELRREQQAQLDDEGGQILKGSRFLLLKNYEKLDQGEKNRLQSNSLKGLLLPLCIIAMGC
ncbi:MAG: transposase [Deltaproteobacteria bacterium]|nr:transposase [Deltaproteobacteria bacterium]